MSQTYVVGCKASVCEVKKASDSVTSKLILTKIVEEGEQKQILSDILKQRGFEEVEGSDGQILTKNEEGLVQIVDLTDMTVTTTLEKEEEIKREKSINVHRGGLSPGERGYSKAEEERLNEELRIKEQAKLKEDLSISEEESARIERKLLQEISARLEETKKDRTEELNDIVKDVYVESLKRKAARMGSVVSTKEDIDDQGNFELRIKLTS